MRKQVRKQVEKMQAIERDRYRTACAKIRQLEIENARLKKELHISEEGNEKLRTIFGQLQAEHEEFQVTSAHDLQIAEAKIDELEQPWWRRWWQRIKPIRPYAGIA